MSVYTLSIAEYIRTFQKTGMNFNDKIEEGRKHIFSFSYPWYSEDADSKVEFERLFCMHYWTDEIGFETLELFKMKLCETLTREMPYYKQLFDTTQIEYNPLVNFERTGKTEDSRKKEQDATTKGENNKNGSINETKKDIFDGNTSANTTGESNSKNEHTSSQNATSKTTNNSSDEHLESDNPQINYSGADYASKLLRTDNTGYTHITDNSNSEGNENFTNTKNETNKSNTTNINDSTRNNIITESVNHNQNSNSTENEHITSNNVESGFSGSKPTEILRYRETIININNMLIDKCEPLFMGFLNVGSLERW